MTRIRIVGLALMAVFAFSAVAATAASAVEGPWWQVEGSRLLSGETRLLLASAKTPFKLLATNAGITVTCTATSLPVASEMHIIGSTGANGGRSLEVIEFSGCTQTGNGAEPGCVVASSKKITTTLVLNLLGYASATRGGPVLVLFAPESGTKFVEFGFTGTCTFPSTTVEGNVIGTAQVGGVAVAVLPAEQKETLHGEVAFPGKGRAIWIENAGVLTEVKSALKAFGVTSQLEGTALLQVDLSSGPVSWGVFT